MHNVTSKSLILKLIILWVITMIAGCKPAASKPKTVAAAATSLIQFSSNTNNISALTTQKISFSLTKSSSQSITTKCQLDSAAESTCLDSSTITTTEGQHTFKVNIYSSVNKLIGSGEYKFTVDLTSPTSTINNPPSMTGSSEYSFNFSGSDNLTTLTYECFVENVSKGSCTSPYVARGLANGNHLFTVKAKDAAGNISPVSSASWTVSLNAPSIVLTSTQAFSGAANLITFNAQSLDSLTLTTTCSLNNATPVTCSNSYQTSNLQTGYQKLEIITKDTLNRTSKVTANWLVDMTIPTIALTAPTNLTANNFSLIFTSSDIGGSGVDYCKCWINSGTQTTCASPYVVPYVSDGAATFSIACYDKASNVSATSTLNLIFDRTAPVVNVTTVPPAFISATNISVNFTATDANGVNSCKCWQNSATPATCTSPTVINYFADGATTLKILCTDNAGNNSLTSQVPLKFDRTPPTVQITNLAIPTFITDATYAMTFTSSDVTSGIGTCSCWMDTGVATTCYSPRTVNYVADGSTIFKVSCADTAGNISTVSQSTLTFDRTPPSLAFSSGSPNIGVSTAQFNFDVSDITGGAIDFSTSYDGGSFQTTSNNPLIISNFSYGTHSIIAKVKDEAGNISQLSYSWRSGASISNSSGHTCFATDAGVLKCWGSNTFGQIGDGTKIDRLAPVTIFNSGVTQVSASAQHTCAVVSGALKCWGTNYGGNFGNGVQSAGSTTPLTVIASGVTMVSTNSSGGCAIVNSALYCWGLGFYAGNGATNNLSPAQIFASGVTSISTSSSHACAVVNASVYCWGLNSYGQVGDGTTLLANTPKLIISSLASSVAVGASYSCATISGELKCWGSNMYGQFGVSTPSYSSTPIQSISSGVSAIVAGTNHMCAQVSGLLKCWGQNTFGQIGDGTLVLNSVPSTIFSGGITGFSAGGNNSCAFVNDVLNCWGSNSNGQLGLGYGSVSLTPTAIAGVTADSIYTGMTSTYAVTNGALKVWGKGPLGDGTSSTSNVPIEIISSGVTYVSAGFDNTACAIVNTALKCWGSIRYLNYANTLTPVTIFSSGVTAVAATSTHICAVVSGALQCWGDNTYGELGDGSYSSSNVPKIIISSGVTNVSVASWSTCAIVNTSLQCWGFNAGGDVGIGSSANTINTPQTTISSGVTAVSSGVAHYCAIVSGVVKCWGYNGSGQSGQTGGQTIIPVPTNVGISNATSIIAKSNSTCAIAGGALWCFGDNNFGLFGDGTSNTASAIPVQSVASGVTQVAIGEFHGCGIINSILKCWGANSMGQYGDGKSWKASPMATVGL